MVMVCLAFKGARLLNTYIPSERTRQFDMLISDITTASMAFNYMVLPGSPRYVSTLSH